MRPTSPGLLLDGGAGTDTADFSAITTAGVTVDLASGAPQATGQGNDTLISIENVIVQS